MTYDDANQEEGRFKKGYSNATALRIDQEVNRLVQAAFASARGIVEAHKEQLRVLADQLLAKEVLHVEQVLEILGPRPEGCQQPRPVDLAAADREASSEGK